VTAAPRLYLWLAVVFVTSLVVADTIGCKLFYVPVFTIGGMQFFKHTCGQLSFPITFLLTDIVNEFYGPKATRHLTLLGFAATLLAFGLYFAAVRIPIHPESPPSFVTQVEFQKVFGLSQQLIVASLTAYVVGQLFDIFVFGAFKRLTRGRYVWLRATGSTLISQLVDTFVVTTIYFWGSGLPLEEKVHIGINGYVLKFVVALALTPLIYLLRWTIRTQVGLQPLPP
jgi:uncharacterized integral membrane protein (TIGR00697 family)